MILKGEKGIQEFEIGKIYKGVQRLINSLWIAEFIPTRDGMFIVSYGRNKVGIPSDSNLPRISMGEDDDRTVKSISISDPSPSYETKNKDEFKVINPKFIFSYEDDPSAEDLNHPDLKKHRSRWVAKKYNLGESNPTPMKYLLLFEGFVKKYGETISRADFKNLKKGQEVMYMGTPYVIEEPDENVLKLKNSSSGAIIDVNYSMFNQKGAIVEK